MKLGIENRKQAVIAIILGLVLLMTVVFQFLPTSSTIASTSAGPTANGAAALPARPGARRGSRSAALKKERPAQSLDPTLHLTELASAERVKYEGTGRNIFVAQAEAAIPAPVAPGTTDGKNPAWQPPAVASPPPIPLKFFGFASKPGEPKKVFLSKDQDVFIAGEGEIIDRRYKVIRISPTSVEVQDVVGSGPPQSIPLTQG